MCVCMCVRLRGALIHTQGRVSLQVRCAPRVRVPVCMCKSVCPAGPRACVRACAHGHDTPQPPHPASTPPVNGADDIGAEESDDKCPLSANEADDKWAGARAAPLRCNNRRWMAWRHPPPTPTPCAGNVTGADRLRPPGREPCRQPGRQSRWAKPPRPKSQEPTRPPAAEEQSSELSGSAGRTGQACLRPGHTAVHPHGPHTRQPPVSLHGAPAAPVQAQPPPHRTIGTCFCAMRGRASATQKWVHTH